MFCQLWSNPSYYQSVSCTLIFFSATLFLGIGGAAESGPLITVRSLPSESVQLHKSSHGVFQAAFSTDRAKGFDRILPYTVVIENASNQDILGYTVLWKCTAFDGVVRTPTRSTFDPYMLTAGRGFASKSSEIVSTVRVLEAGGKSWDTSIETEVNRLLDLYSHQTSVEISLDAVLFADGTVIGPDVSQSIAKWKAWLDAQRIVFNAAVNSSSADLKLVLQSLAEPGTTAAHRIPRQGTRHFTDFGMMADRAKTYEDCFDLAKAYYASAILDELSQNNRPTIQNLRMNLAKIHYPEVHRKLGSEEPK